MEACKSVSKHKRPKTYHSEYIFTNASSCCCCTLTFLPFKPDNGSRLVPPVPEEGRFLVRTVSRASSMVSRNKEGKQPIVWTAGDGPEF